MTRRRFVLLALLGAAFAAAVWQFLGGPLPLALKRTHPVMARAYPQAIAASETGPGLLVALGWLDATERRESTRAALAELATTAASEETVDLGLGPGDAEPELPGRSEDGPATMPREAAALAATTDGLLLLVHVPRPGDFALPARQRGWLGPRLLEVAASAESLTVAVAETGPPATVRVTLALAFADGAAAEAALRRLTEVQGDVGQLGLAAQPGYERIVRRTRLVVIRLEVGAALARAKLRAR